MSESEKKIFDFLLSGTEPKLNKVKREKRDFVEGLNESLEMIRDFSKVEYKDVEGREIVKITWPRGGFTLIDVSANSLTAILMEIARAMYGEVPQGEIQGKSKWEWDEKFEETDNG